MNRHIFLISTLLILLASCSQTQEIKEHQTEPLSIILIIGDGMGLSHLSSLYYYGEGKTVLSEFPYTGFINTSSSTHKITDSGAGGTAFACGKRTYNGAIGVGADSVVIENITELLAKRNYKNGIIASCAITHATPAAFYAHTINRNHYEDIAAQLPASTIDFFAAGGRNYFTRRRDGENLYDRLLEHNYIIDTVKLAFPSTIDKNRRYGFLIADNHPPKAHQGRGDFLAKATTMALEYFSASSHGFFLMVEASQIDWAGHDNDAEYLIAEMLDFDNTIAVALEFARKHGNTLVIVTSDHETGGFTLAAKGEYDVDKGDYDQIDPIFSTPGHSASLVPVLAFGPGAENFTGIFRNDELFHKIIKLVGQR